MNLSTRPIGATPLPFLGVLRVAGPDALAFLQGQLTNDVRLLADGRTQLAAVCSPQGRVIALLRLRQDDDAVHALLPTDLVQHVSGLLRRYVLRSKVQIQVAAELQVGWIDCSTSSESIDTAIGAARTAVAESSAGATPVVRFDYAPGRRVVAASDAAWQSGTGLSLGPPQPGVLHAWSAADIEAGLPQVFAATSEAFVPQMLNLDLLDAISFSKGCYTGQEIVARTQHLGRIKRRLCRYRLPPGPEPAPLAGLFLDATKTAEVVMSAIRDSGVDLLAVTILEALGARLHTGDGREAVPLDLPYPVAERD